MGQKGASRQPLGLRHEHVRDFSDSFLLSTSVNRCACLGHLQLLGGVFPRWRTAFRVVDRPLRPHIRHRLALRRQHWLILRVYRFPELYRAGGPLLRRLSQRRFPPGLGFDHSRHCGQRPAGERPLPRGARHLAECRRGVLDLLDVSLEDHHQGLAPSTAAPAGSSSTKHKTI